MKANIKSIKFYFLLASMLLFILPLTSNAQAHRGRAKGDWIKLGERKVTKAADHDVIEMNRRDGTFTKMKFRIAKSPVYVDNIVVVFENGEKETVHIDRNFGIGEWSSVIDFPGNKRFIDRIVFNYHTKFAAIGKGKIIVFGKS